MELNPSRTVNMELAENINVHFYGNTPAPSSEVEQEESNNDSINSYMARDDTEEISSRQDPKIKRTRSTFQFENCQHLHI